MTRRERLLATLQGQQVDRPPVSFYELDGQQDPTDPDPFNIFNHPSWKPLLELVKEKTDIIFMQSIPFRNEAPDPVAELRKTEKFSDENGNYITVQMIRAGRRLLVLRQKRERNINTVWTVEHLCKDIDDLKAWIELPERPSGGVPDINKFLAMEKRIDNAGIGMIDCADPLCYVASLFDLGTYTVIALTEQEIFHRALEKISSWLLPRVEAVAKMLPGRLWRIVGPEYASPPYLPPSLFKEYVTEYDKHIVEIIHRYKGFARIHSHGRLKDILDDICTTGCMGLDPIEPPPQGDVELSYVRSRYGKQLVLFGNLEVSDIENLPTEQFTKKVTEALKQGTLGEGRGFVLMPTACPLGRVLSSLTLKNYEKIIEMVEKMIV